MRWTIGLISDLSETSFTIYLLYDIIYVGFVDMATSGRLRYIRLPSRKSRLARDVFIPAGNQRSTIFWQLLVALVFCRPDAFVGRWIFFSLLVPVR